MFAESTALRLIRAAYAAQFHKNGSFRPFLWNSDIVTMRISIDAARRVNGRCRVFAQICAKTLHLNKAIQP